MMFLNNTEIYPVQYDLIIRYIHVNKIINLGTAYFDILHVLIDEIENNETFCGMCSRIDKSLLDFNIY